MVNYILTLLAALAACTSALPSTNKAPTNLLRDPGFENFPKKDLNKQNVFGPKGKGAAGWIIEMDAVVLSNALSPAHPTPYGEQFVRFHNFTGTNPRFGGAIQQYFAHGIPADGNYTTTFRYRVTQAPTKYTCIISSFYAEAHRNTDTGVQMGDLIEIDAGSTSTVWKEARLRSVVPLKKGLAESVDYAISCAKNSGAWKVDIDQVSFFASD